MSLAAASEARKERLVALRRRKTGQAIDEYVCCAFNSLSYSLVISSSAESEFKPRNFDPETRTIKKRTRDDDVEMQDTVEKDIANMAEEIIQEDKARQAQDLVCRDTIGHKKTQINRFACTGRL
jgi:coiled-coil domain-containing protein 12